MPVNTRNAPNTVEDPVVALDERGADEDEREAHDERAHDTPEQDPVLELAGHREGREDEREHEHVVDAQRVLDDVAREPGDPRLASPARGTRHAEHDGDGYPDRGPGERLARRHHVRGPMEDPQVQREEDPDEEEERDPEDQVHEWGPALLTRGMLRVAWGRGTTASAQGEGRSPAPGRGPGPGRGGEWMAAERPEVTRCGNCATCRTRSAMGGWVLNRVPALPPRGFTVYRWAMAAGTGCCALPRARDGTVRHAATGAAG